MKKTWLVALLLASACASSPTPSPQPIPPVPIVEVNSVAVILKNPDGQPLAGVSIKTEPEVAYSPTNQDGYSVATLKRGVSYHFSFEFAGFNPGEATLTVNTNTDLPFVLVPKVAPYPFAPESGFVTRDSKYFFNNGKMWSWRGSTQFMLFGRYLRGEDVLGALKTARKNGVNVLRVFGRVAGSGWPDWMDFNYPERRPDYTQKLGAFFDLLASFGLRVEIVPLTYPDEEGAQRARLQQTYDVAAGRWNVFVEGANEPGVNSIDIVSIYRGVDRRGVISSYGLYDQTCDGVNICTLAMLDYVTVHTDRGPEWVRKVKDLLEWRDGFGDPSDAMNWFGGTGRPTVGDEPMGADETNQPGRRSNVVSDFAQSFSVCMTFSAGCTFHSQAGLRSDSYGPVQQQIADAILEVWKFIPPIAQSGHYTRGGLEDLPVSWRSEDESLRTYGMIVGSDAWVTDVRPDQIRKLSAINGWRIAGSAGNGTIVHLVK